MQSLEIEVDVSESYINRVQAGQPVEATLDSYPEWRIPASVVAIIPAADRQKATVKVRVAFKELDPRILPDMSVKVAFQSTDEPTVTAEKRITVPEAAVTKRGDKDVVFLYRDGSVERRAISIAERRNERATISAGLVGGEKIILNPTDSLSDGDRVKEERP
jgi:RND family efflux transporter MFP subunit